MSKLLVAEPSQLALPPISDGESITPSGNRRLEVLSAPIPKIGPGYALFGVHDIRGRGTHVEPSPHVDPFIFAHFVSLPPGVNPPFCAHPHCGASVASILLQGGAIKPWDNVRGWEPAPLLPGGVYHVDTGAGCVHDEPTEAVSLRPRTRPGFGDEPDAHVLDASAPTVIMQLWWNAVDTTAAAGTALRPVTSEVVSPSKVPRLTVDGGIEIRVLAGSYRGSVDPLAATVVHPVLLLHTRLLPGADGVLEGLPAEWNGFLWVVEGALTVGTDPAVEVASGDRGLLRLPPGGDSLRLRNESRAAHAKVLIGLGRPHRRPCYKYVGYGGGLIHRSIDEVQAAMADYEADPKGYGRAAAVAKAVEVDMSRYTLVGGFQSDGGDMMERPPGVVARFAYAKDPHLSG